MPLAALIPAIGLIVGDIISATGAVVNCYALHRCGRDLSNIIPRTPQMRIEQRQAGLCGVPQYNFDLCQQQLHGVTIVTSIPNPGEAQFDNVPPACMDLSTVLTGACGVSGPTPIPCGSACLMYTGVSDADMASLSSALASYAQ